MREGGTLAEGWLHKGAFNLTADGANMTNRLKPWNKRWFVLCDDGKLYYYKTPEDARQAKVPIDMNSLSSVAAVNGPLEFELKVGKRTLRLKATETAERQRWMAALQSYLDTHVADRQAALTATQKRFLQAGTGIRDVDQRAQTHQQTAHEGWLYRQDTDQLMRRWRKWWCVVGEGDLTCLLFETQRLSDLPTIARGRSGGDKSREQPTASPSAAEPLAEEAEHVPARISASVALPLAMVSVREARQLSVPYAFEVISPQQTVVLQAQSQEEMALWIEVIQNATATSLGCAMRTPRMSSISGNASVWGKLHRTDGNGQCADCGAPNPSWASINLGAVVCLACAGIHRQMGVHNSKVRSLELDVKEWSEPLILLMMSLGNDAVNSVWQPALETAPLAGADATATQREAHIRNKYEHREFLDAAGPPAAAMHLAALRDDVVLLAACLAHRLDVDALAPAAPSGEWTAAMVDEHAGRTALHVAAASGSPLVLELLLQNMAASSAGVDSGDACGKSALKLAVEAGHAHCVTQLITRGANISFADHQQQTPMSAAAEKGHAAISEAMLQYKLAQDEKLLRQIEVE